MLLSVRFSEVLYVVVCPFQLGSLCCLSISVRFFMLLSVRFSEVVYVVVCPFQ